MIEDVAVLFIDPKGDYPRHYAHCWDEKRDAMTYALDLPVIAHPPCQRWCRLAGLVEARWGYKRGEDGGCFASALTSLRRVGGVLEHPAYSDAWAAHGLPRPVSGGEWCPGAAEGEWTCYVEQWRYGHKAKKATWLYYVGMSEPPALRWGYLHDAKCLAAVKRAETRTGRFDATPGPTMLVSWCGNHTASGEKRERLGKAAAIRTPPEFREALLRLARHAVL